MEEGYTSEELEVSLYTLTGITTTTTMQLAVQFGSYTRTTVIDSVSMHSFIDVDTACALHFQPQPRPGLMMGMANADRVTCSSIYENVHIKFDDEWFTVDFYIISLRGHEVMLGVHWLCFVGPVLFDFERLTMKFYRDGHTVRWQGTSASRNLQYRATSAADLLMLLDQVEDVF